MEQESLRHSDNSASWDWDYGRKLDHEPFRESIRSDARPRVRGASKMMRTLNFMSPIHNLIILCGFMAAVGFGMLIGFNKRVAEERAERVIVTFGIEMPLVTLTSVRVSDI